MSTVTLTPGQSVGLSVSSIFPDGYGPIQGVASWVSNHPSIASVTFNTAWVNNHPTAIVKAISLGNATITCTVGILTSQVFIVVASPPSPSSLEIAVGDVVPNPFPGS